MRGSTIQRCKNLFAFLLPVFEIHAKKKVKSKDEKLSRIARIVIVKMLRFEF